MDDDDLVARLMAGLRAELEERGRGDELALARFRRACRRLDSDPAEQRRIDELARELPEP